MPTDASEIRRVFREQDLAFVLDAYVAGIKDVFAFSLAGGALTVVLLAFVIPFNKLPSHA